MKIGYLKKKRGVREKERLMNQVQLIIIIIIILIIDVRSIDRYIDLYLYSAIKDLIR